MLGKFVAGQVAQTFVQGAAVEEKNRGRPVGVPRVQPTKNSNQKKHGKQEKSMDIYNVPKCFCFPNVSVFEVPIFQLQGCLFRTVLFEKNIPVPSLEVVNSMLQENMSSPTCVFASFWLFPSWHGTQQISRLMGVERCAKWGCAEKLVDGFLQGHSVDLMFFQGMDEFKTGMAT